jgi:hypothetical protein
VTVLLPLDVHPHDDPAAWARVAAAGSLIIAIVHNGPSEAVDSLRSAGVVVLQYACLGTQMALAEGFDGVFYDRVPTALCDLATVTRQISRSHGMIVLNPGTRCHPGYALVADVICTFEGSWADYRDLPDGPEFDNAAHLVFGVPAADLPAAQVLLDKRVRSGLVTDLDVPLPYRGIPSWLSATAPSGNSATA